MTLTTEAARTVAGVDGRYFLIQPDGSIKHKNSFDKHIVWVFDRKQSAESHASRQPGVRVWDKVTGAFL